MRGPVVGRLRNISSIQASHQQHVFSQDPAHCQSMQSRARCDIRIAALWNHSAMRTKGAEPDVPRSSHRVEYLVAVAMSVVVAIVAAVGIATVSSSVGRLCHLR